MSELVSSKLIRLAAALAYATIMIWIVPRTRSTVPILLIALGLPFVFRLVPRNWLYGTRTWRSLTTTEETWYRQNVIGGVVMVVGGLIWLAVLALRG